VRHPRLTDRQRLGGRTGRGETAVAAGARRLARDELLEERARVAAGLEPEPRQLGRDVARRARNALTSAGVTASPVLLFQLLRV
jgi:hypothetical protein